VVSLYPITQIFDELGLENSLTPLFRHRTLLRGVTLR
jgi:hypothetical protein